MVKTRVILFIVGLTMTSIHDNNLLLLFGGLLLMAISVIWDYVPQGEYSDNRDTPYSRNNYSDCFNLDEYSDSAKETRRLKDLESQERFKNKNEYWNDKRKKEDLERHTFEVHYITYNYNNTVIKEIVYGNNILEVTRRFQADPKVKKLIKVV